MKYAFTFLLLLASQSLAHAGDSYIICTDKETDDDIIASSGPMNSSGSELRMAVSFPYPNPQNPKLKDDIVVKANKAKDADVWSITITIIDNRVGGYQEKVLSFADPYHTWFPVTDQINCVITD